MNNKHIPGRVQISTECNQQCLFCSVPKGPAENPSLKEIKKRIIDLKKLGTNDLFITGGEPLIHPQIITILEFAKKIGFNEITIQSNASNITENLLKKIILFDRIIF